MKKVVIVGCILGLLVTGCGSKGEKDVSKNTGKETFTVGMECAYAPFNWQTSKQTETSVALQGGAGYCDGYDVMIARRIAKELDREIVVKKIAWEGLQPALNSGEIDAIIAGMTKDPEREKGMDFTTPYYKSNMVMLVRKDTPEAQFKDIQQFKGKKVLGQLSTNYDTVIKQIDGVDHVTPKKTYPEMIVALQKKDVDAITAETPVSMGVIAQNKDLVMITFEQGKGFDVDPSVSVAMKKGSKSGELFEKIQKIIDGITAKEQEELMKKAVEMQPKTGA